MFLFVRWKFPNLLDRESVDPVEFAALQSAPLAVDPVAPDGGWPQWFGPHRDGRAPESPLRTDWDANPPAVVWSVPGGGGYSSLAIVDGKLYTHDLSDGQERVRCLNTDGGETVWSHDYPVDYQKAGIGYGAGPRATPRVHEGRVYALGATGVFVCLDTTGNVVWQHDLVAEFGAAGPQWGLASSPLIDEDRVIVQAGGGLGSVAAFDRTTGNLIWKAGDDSIGYSSPVVADVAGTRQVIAVTGTSVLGVRPDSGDVLWRVDWKTQHDGNIATPLVVGDYVFVSANYGKGCQLLHLTPSDGGVSADVVYFRKGRVMMTHHSTCVHRDGYLYGFDMNDLRCVDLRAGEINEDWIARPESGGRLDKGCVILAGDKLIGLTQTGTLFLADADPEEFRFHGRVEDILTGNECWALPVLVNGRIYLRDSEKVLCLDVRPSP